MILSYKAEVAASRGTLDDLNAAIGFLNAADKLTSDKAQSELIARTIATHKASISALEEQAAAEQAAAAAEAELEAITAEQAEDMPEEAAEESAKAEATDAEQH